MPIQRDIAVLVGSLRKESYTRRAAEALTRLPPPQLSFRFIDIVVSLYNQDLDSRRQIGSAYATISVPPMLSSSPRLSTTVPFLAS